MSNKCRLLQYILVMFVMCLSVTIQGRLFRPFPGKFGTEVSLDISTFLQKDGREKTVNVLMEGLHRHRFLLFRGQNITWQNMIRFGELFGALYEESSHVNRKKFAGDPPFFPMTQSMGSRALVSKDTTWMGTWLQCRTRQP
jgi:hypothetical protein